MLCVNGGDMKQTNFKANKTLAQIYGAAISFMISCAVELNQPIEMHEVEASAG